MMGVDLTEIILGSLLTFGLINEAVWFGLPYSTTLSMMHSFFGDIVNILCQFFDYIDELD
jgi:hypothetical protein